MPLAPGTTSADMVERRTRFRNLIEQGYQARINAGNAAIEAQIAETERQTQAILDGIKANQQAQLEGQVTQANTNAQGQQSTRTLIAGALAQEDDNDAQGASNSSAASFGQLRAKKRATLLEGL